MVRSFFAGALLALLLAPDISLAQSLQVPGVSSTPLAGVPSPSPAAIAPPPVTPIPPGGPNAPTPTATDTTSKICIPVMAMLQAINCSNYPSQLQAFCTQNKPHLMTMQDCQNAEKYAQNVPPAGPHKQECMNQTFVNGGSSWSFVLACANTKSAQGATGDPSQANNKVGITNTDNPSAGGGVGSSNLGGGSVGNGNTPADPQCLATLQSTGAKFQGLGQYQYSGELGTCTVQTAVKYSFKTIPYSGIMDCNLAKMMDKWELALRGLGVTQVTSLGTLGCRGMNNAQGHSSTPSKHSLGYAADFGAFVIGGQNYAVARIRTDPATAAKFQTIVNTMCEMFDLTLAMQFYGPGQIDVHGQFSQHGCDPHGKY